MTNKMDSQPLNRVVFWEPCLSPHKSELIREFSALNSDIETICCSGQELPTTRKEMGWSVDSQTKYITHVTPSFEIIEKLISTHNTLHIFSGIRWVKTITTAINLSKKHNAKFAIMHEPRVREGLKGELRYIQSLITERWLKRNSQFVLAIGRHGPKWFSSVGYPKDRIFPFAYFVPKPNQQSSRTYKNNTPIKIGYLGRLIRAKGIFDLPPAISQLGHGYELHFAGKGPEEEDFIETCKALGIVYKFHGTLKMEEVGDFLTGVDILVLPSITQDDGWGVVVSESLMCGIPVVATNSVGSSILLEDPRLGRVVDKKSPSEIAKAIVSLKESGALTTERKDLISNWAKEKIDARAGASYLSNIIKWSISGNSRPSPFYE